MKNMLKILKTTAANGGVLSIYDPSDLSLTGCPSAFRNVVFHGELGNVIWQIDGRESCDIPAAKNDTIIGTRIHKSDLQLVTFGGHFFDIDISTAQTDYFGWGK